jgi:hypothetical protein
MTRGSHQRVLRVSSRRMARAQNSPWNASWNGSANGWNAHADAGWANAHAEYTPRTRGRSARSRHGRAAQGRVRVAHHQDARGSWGGWNATW